MKIMIILLLLMLFKNLYAHNQDFKKEFLKEVPYGVTVNPKIKEVRESLRLKNRIKVVLIQTMISSSYLPHKGK